MRTVELSEENVLTILWALDCMWEHVQYEDEWSESKRDRERARYRDAQIAVEPARAGNFAQA